MSARLNVDRGQLDAFCRRWKVVRLDLFGSVLREDFRPDSDIDVLVTFAPDADWGLLEHAEMAGQLGGILGAPVDLVTRRAVERSDNPIRRREILESAETLYAA